MGHKFVLDVPWSLHIGCTRQTHSTQVISFVKAVVPLYYRLSSRKPLR